MEQSIETLEVRLDKAESDIAELYNKTTECAVNQATITEKLSNILVTMGEIKQAVGEIQLKPVQRMDQLFTAAGAAAVSCVLGYLIGFFLK